MEKVMVCNNYVIVMYCALNYKYLQALLYGKLNNNKITCRYGDNVSNVGGSSV